MRLNQSVLYISLRHIWTPKKRTCKNVHVTKNAQLVVSKKIVKKQSWCEKWFKENQGKRKSYNLIRPIGGNTS